MFNDFAKRLRKEKLDKKYNRALVEDAESGLGDPFGAQLYKLRLSRIGEGKSGGYRNIYFWKKGELIMFFHMFPKSETDNISAHDLKAFKVLAKEVNALNDAEIKTLLRNGTLKEIAL